MPKPLLNAALGIAMALCSSQALAGEDPAGKFGFITGGGEGGDSAGDKSNYYYIYLGASYDIPLWSLPWRFSAMALGHGGIWRQYGFSGEGYQGQAWRLMGGPWFSVNLPDGWWVSNGIQVGLDWEDAGPGFLPLMLQDELELGRELFSTYWNLNVRPTPYGGLRVTYLVGQIFLRVKPWFAFGPELRLVTSAPSIGLMARIGEDRPRQRWCVTAGSTFDEKVGVHWHLDLWFAL